MRPRVSKKALLEQFKRALLRAKDVPCADCGNRFSPWVMDVIHVTDDTKRTHVSKAIKTGTITDGTIFPTMFADLSVVCSNCNRERLHRLEIYKQFKTKKNWLRR